jgi:methanogenic corrinoid protein MtbC1/DNA-binding CsgD family transcriptional regulator
MTARGIEESRFPLALLEHRYGEALAAGDLWSALGVIDEALERRIPATEIHTKVIEPAMARASHPPAESPLSVAEEHLATQITYRALARLAEPLRTDTPPSREQVLLAAVEGERHGIGLQMAADVLGGAGFRVLLLGADVPTTSLVAAVAARRPAVTGLACNWATPALVDAVAALDEAALDTRLFLGGDGVPSWLREHPYPWVHRSMGVVEAVESLLDSPAQVAPDQVRRSRRSSLAGTGSRRRSVRRRTPGRTIHLTPRQTQVLQGLADAKSTDQIAGELYLTPVTVRNHIANILAALGVHSRLQAVVAARRRGLID